MPLLHFNFIEIVPFPTYHTNFLLALPSERHFLTIRKFYLSNFDLFIPTYQKHLSISKLKLNIIGI